MRTLFLQRFEQTDDHSTNEVLVVFISENYLDDAEFVQAILEDVEANLWSDQILIIARKTAVKSIKDTFAKSPRIAAFLKRFPRMLPVALSGFKLDGTETYRHHLFGEARISLAYEEFQTDFMTRIFVRRAGLIRSTPSFHFKNPSDRHTSQFMRVSNILVRKAEVSFFAFCALKYIPNDTAFAYVDTPALFGLVAAINDHRLALQSTYHLSVDSFGSYEGLKKYKLTKTEDAIVFISASSSGSLAREVVRVEPLFDPKRVIHLVYLGPNDDKIKAICNLKKRIKINPNGLMSTDGDYRAGNCPMCSAGSVAIQLEGEQFEIAAPKPEPVLIVETDAHPRLKDTMSRLVGKNILGLGLGGSRGGFSRQFEVSPLELLESTNFQERLSYIFSRSIPASIATIIFLDEGSKPLALQMESICGKENVEIISAEVLRTMERSESSAAVVIAAAVIESGRRLQDVSRDLRAAFPHAPQIYVVGFAKTTSEERLKTLRLTLVRTARPQLHELVTVEMLVLPLSNQTNAWSSERDLLTRCFNLAQFPDSMPSDVEEIFRRRLAFLSNAANSLKNDIFIANTREKSLKLQHGFVFWSTDPSNDHHSQADVYFTIASVLEGLRANSMKPGAKALRADGLQYTLLSAANFGRFNDGIIQASLLRAAHPYELNYSAEKKQSSEMGRIVRRILESSDRPRGEAAAEFLIAIATGRLSFDNEDYKAVLAPLDSAPPVVEVLLKLCHSIKNVSSS